MKITFVKLGLITAALGLAGCETYDGQPNRTGTGALMGGALGAMSGALLGGRHAGEGALIGGAIGAGAGAVIGNSMDQDERSRLRSQAPATYARVQQGQPVGLTDIKELTRAGLSDDAIIGQIHNSGTVFHLSTLDLEDLKSAGVSDRVIQYMISPEPVVVQGPPPPPQTETMIVSPGPGFYWVGGEWLWLSGRWVWSGGHWARPPRPGVIYVPGGWERRGGGYVHIEGHWR